MMPITPFHNVQSFSINSDDVLFQISGYWGREDHLYGLPNQYYPHIIAILKNLSTVHRHLRTFVSPEVENIYSHTIIDGQRAQDIDFVKALILSSTYNHLPFTLGLSCESKYFLDLLLNVYLNTNTVIELYDQALPSMIQKRVITREAISELNKIMWTNERHFTIFLSIIGYYFGPGELFKNVLITFYEFVTTLNHVIPIDKGSAAN